MARTDNLSNYLTDIATAIKEKKGDSTSINASDFDTEIANLPSGGGSLLYPTTLTFKNNTSTSIDTNIIRPDNMTSFAELFDYCTNVQSLDFSNWGTINNVTAINSMFRHCESISRISLTNLGTCPCTTMSQTFTYCESVEEIDISNFNTTNATMSFNTAFAGCTSLQKLDARSLDFTKSSETDTNKRRIFGSSSSNYVPADCLIIVADSTQKDWFTTYLPRLTNVKTVAELEE